MDVFLDDIDRRRFLQLLTHTVERFDCEVWNHCVMSNHYHLLVYMRGPALSDAMQYLNGEYGKWWNARHERVGHTFQGRFKNQIVQRDGGRYLQNVCRYMSLNPVRANIVRRASEWPWSSHRAIVGIAQPPAFLTIDGVLEAFGAGEEARRAFAAFVDTAPDDWDDWLERIRSREMCLGDTAFKRSVSILHEREGDATLVT